MDEPGIEPAHSNWKSLYRLGGVAPLVTIVFYLTQVLIMITGREPYPVTTQDWFLLFQHRKILALFYINALDSFSIAILGVMFLALYIALRQANQSYMLIATFFALIGIPVFIVPRVATLAVIPLSEQYAAAAGEAQRSQLLAAGDALGALGTATTQTIGFFFIAVAVLIISLIMLRSTTFGKLTAYLGILASVITFIDDLSTIIAPSIADILLGIGGLIWIIWWILISRRLLQLGRPDKQAFPQPL